MMIRTTDYYNEFYCLADACPKTCCAHWNIPIDRVTRAHYKSLQGELGEHARKVLKGGTFKNKDGKCPFLLDSGLCSMILAAGNQDDISFVCRTYPRKISTYGNEQYISLSVSCPMAARQLIHAKKIRFVTTQTNEPPQMNDIDPAVYKKLVSVRDTCISLIQDDSTRLKHRVQEMLHQFGLSTSTLTDRARFSKLVRLYLRMRYNDRHMQKQIRSFKRSDVLERVLKYTDVISTTYEQLFENLLVYMLDRYVLEAVDDAAFESRILLCLHWCMMLFLLLCDVYAKNETLDEAELERILVDFSRHTEHNDRNLRLLMRVKGLIVS